MAKHIPQIPKELAHLKVDERGYPIPFFVTKRDGKPDFVLLNTKRQDDCIEGKLCPICGKKLYKDYQYVITGPIGLKNRYISDPPMHRICAEFSMQACPHMHFQKAERKDLADIAVTQLNKDIHSLPKPEILYLVKIHKYKKEPVNGTQQVIRFWPVSQEEWVYENGILIKKQ